MYNQTKDCFPGYYRLLNYIKLRKSLSLPSRLPSWRIVNRVKYGTDYDPEVAGFSWNNQSVDSFNNVKFGSAPVNDTYFHISLED